jgi:hypothetical protein
MDKPKVIPGSRNIAVHIPPNRGPAAIRYNNPGAQWPNAQAEKYGMTGYGRLNDGYGNKIAYFPNAVYGAAANMALLSTGYVGMTISAGQFKWSGSHRAGLQGWDASTVITKEMARDPTFVIPFMKSIANAEAPGGARVLSEAQWQEAFNLYLQIEGAAPSKATPAAKTKGKVPAKTTTAGATTAIATAAWYSGAGPYVIGGIVLVGVAVIAYLILKNRS